MKTSTIIWIIVVLVIVIGGIWWLSSRTAAIQPSTQTATSTPTVSLGSNAQFPAFLTAANGMTLYIFKSDTPGVSTCSGTCITEWPAYTVPSATGLMAAANIPGTFSTITRSDGTLQVAYNGMPLYFWIHDTKPGDVTGNAQDNFVVAVPGQAAQTQATAPASAKAKTTLPAPVTSSQPAPAPSAPAPSSGY